jgi:hypothetical protein
MKITKRCMFDGKTYTMDLPITEQRWAEIDLRRAFGGNIQDVAPELNADQREFLMTGTPGHVWDKMFGNDND